MWFNCLRSDPRCWSTSRVDQHRGLIEKRHILIKLLTTFFQKTFPLDVNSNYLSINGHKIHCLKWGQGDHLVIALHGFGEHAASFNFLERLGNPALKICAIDLPFHGSSIWKEKHFRPVDILQIINAIIEGESPNQLTLIGHSLGARLILGLIMEETSLFQRAILINPDGFRTRRMGIGEIVPGIIRSFIRDYLFSAPTILKLGRILHRISIIDGFSIRYLRHNLADKNRQNRLMNTWVSLATFPVFNSKLKKQVQRSSAAIAVILGKNDSIIDVEKTKKQLQSTPKVNLLLMEGGHQLPSMPKLKRTLNEMLSQPNSAAEKEG